MGQKQHSDLVLPPHHVQAEQAILGALLLNNAVLGELGDLGEADFYRDDHRRIFRHACRVIEDGGVADLVTVSASLDAADESQFSGGVAYLGAIIDAATALAAVPSYVRLVRQAAIKRGLMAAYQQAAFSAGNGIDAEAVIELTDERIAVLRSRARDERSRTVSKSIVPVREFLATSRPADWIVQGMVQRGYLYACTAPTNMGKTAVQIVQCLCVASGKAFCGAPVKRSKVVILCGENQDGFRVRLRATMADMQIRPESLDGWLYVLPVAAPLGTLIEPVIKQINDIGEVGLVLIDTSTAYFGGDKEDDNVQALEHARMMRRLCECSGRPAVVANCHPPKHTADREGCVPRGGSAFLNEIDGNFSVWAEGAVCDLHWTRKKRGPDFEAMAFEFVPAVQIDCGIEVKTVVARWVDAIREETLRRELTDRENMVLRTLLSYPKSSMAWWCQKAGFLDANGAPQKSSFHSVLVRLERWKLTGRNRAGWFLTKAGEAEAKG